MAPGSSVDTAPSAYEQHDIQTCTSQFVAVWFQYRNTVPTVPSGEFGDNDGVFDSWLLDTNREATEQVAIIGNTRVVLTRVVKGLLDDIKVSGSKWNEHLENEEVPGLSLHPLLFNRVCSTVGLWCS